MPTGTDPRRGAGSPPDNVFRFPTEDDPEPGGRRLLAMALYAATLGLLGLATAIRGVLAILGGATPGWYEPAFVATTLLGVLLAVGAFLSLHRRLLPWLLLFAASGPLAATIALTANAA
jgi:hypothetical protein